MVDCGIYTIGWICAIRAELVAAQELLDKELEEIVPTPENDNNNYTLGKIGEHHVVIAGLPRGQYGGTSAANAARDMVRTFPNVRIGFMVGIGGGIPTQHDIRLGDVVVGSPTYRSGGLIQYDHGTTVQGRGINLMGSLNQPPLPVLAAITKLSAHHVRKGHNLDQTIEEVLLKNTNLIDEGFQRPHDDTDKLYESTFIHSRAGARCLDVCPASNLKPRDPRTKGQGKPKIHYGLIASGSQLMEDATVRDELAEKEHVLCFEMEAAGLANHFPCVVIRGICDYSDSHRGREWQGYAALVAAAYAKQLLLQIPPQKIKEERKMKDVLQQIEGRLEPIAETKEIVEALNVKRKREDDLKIVDWLGAADYSSEQHGFLQPEQRQPGTGQQFLSSEDFQNWLETKNSFLFCSGMPGAGKTITTAITIEYLHSKFGDDPTVGLAYVYCSYQKRDEQKPQDLFASLLGQLALSQSPFPKAMDELYEKNHYGKKRPSFKDIMDTLCQVVKSFLSTFILIDALDEHESWDKFLSDVLVLREETTANIFLTSRPKPSLPGKLEGCLIHDIQADDQDVELYINQRMAQMMVLSEQNTELSKELKEDCRNSVREKLSRAVNGVFLLARIYLDNLKEETKLKDIYSFLDHLPTGLAAYKDAYEKTIRRIRNQGQQHRDLARKALMWLTFSQESLTKTEFRHALSVEDDMSVLKEEDLESTTVILHACMDLVMIDEGSETVRLLHFTTMEYLKANPNCLRSLESPDNPKFIENPSDLDTEKRVAREYYEMKLASTCLTYLLFEEFSSGQFNAIDEMGYSSSDISDIQRRLGKHPLYSYAARYWAYHARRGEPCIKMLNFLKSDPHVSSSSQCIPEFRCGLDQTRFQTRLGCVTGLHLTAVFGLEGETASLLSSGMEPDVKDGCGRTPLSYASEAGHTKVVSQLLDFTVDVESKSDWEFVDLPRTALSHAAKQGHTEIVSVLLNKGRATPDSNPSFVERQSVFERTPLSFASEAGHLNVVNLLLGASGITPNLKVYPYWTPLHHAAQAGHRDIVEALLNMRDVDPESRDRGGMSPLHLAARAGHETTTKHFIATKKVDPDLVDDNGMTPLSLAAKVGQEEVVRLLLGVNKEHREPQEDRDGCLFPTLLKPWPKSETNQSLKDRIRSIIVHGHVYANSKDHKGRTPLFHAALQGHVSIVKFFLARSDAEPNIQDFDRRTPLSHTVYRNNGISQLLLASQGIKPDMEDDKGRTPLSYAAESRCHSGFQLLLADNRVRPDSRDASGRTPLSYAAGYGDAFKVKLLLENPGVDPNVTDTLGRTPFSYAAEKAEAGCCKLFIADAHVEVDSQDTPGRTPLAYLARRAEVLKTKLDMGLDGYKHHDSSAEYFHGQDQETLGQIRTLTWELVTGRNVDLFSSDKDWLTPAIMMPELLQYERKRPSQQKGMKRKYVSE